MEVLIFEIRPLINNLKVIPLYRNYNVNTLNTRSDYVYQTVIVSKYLGGSVASQSKLNMTQTTYKEQELKGKHLYINTYM